MGEAGESASEEDEEWIAEVEVDVDIAKTSCRGERWVLDGFMVLD